MEEGCLGDESDVGDSSGQLSATSEHHNDTYRTHSLSETRSLSSISDSTLQSASQWIPQMESKFVDERYTTQFLGFTPKSFCNGVYNAFNELVTDHLETLSNFLQQQFCEEISRDQVHQGCEDIRLGFISTFDKSFDKLEKYLEGNLLHIPNNVLLNEDGVHGTAEPTVDEENKVDGDILRLTKKIRAMKYANAALSKELREAEFAQSQCDQILTQLVSLERTRTQAKVVDLRESLIFTVDKADKCIDDIQRLPPISVLSPPHQMDCRTEAEMDTLIISAGKSEIH